MEIRSTVAAGRPRRPLAGLHPGRGPGVRGDRRRPRADPALHLGAQHRRRRHRRHRRARPRRHRPGRRDAGDGGQGRAVQAVRRRRRRADLPGHHRRRGDRRDRRPAGARASAASTSRTSPRRAASRSSSGSRSGWTSRSSTTTSTAPPWSPWPRWRTRCASPAATADDPRWSSPAPARPASRWPGSCSRPASGTSPSLDRQGVLNSARDDLTPVKRGAGRRHRRPLRPHRQASPTRWTARTSTSASPAAPCPRSTSPRWPPDAIIFGLANPNPEVHPEVAHRYARVVATGRSDFPNQINNVLAFPGIFRGALDVRATAITEGMKLAAADALAGARRRRPARGPDHPGAVRPAGRPGRRRGRRGRRAPRRGGPRLAPSSGHWGPWHLRGVHMGGGRPSATAVSLEQVLGYAAGG